MKNIQVVDGASNTTLPVYRVSDASFALVFRTGTDIAFFDEVEARLRDEGRNPVAVLSTLWEEATLVQKQDVDGIDGTLHMRASSALAECFPNRSTYDAWPYGDAGAASLHGGAGEARDGGTLAHEPDPLESSRALTKRVRQELAAARGEGRKVRITRPFRDEHTNGFVLDVGDDLVIVQQFHDFYEEGCSVLRLCDIDDVRSGEHERYWERLFAAEGIRRREQAPLGVRATRMADVLRACQEAGAGAIVEYESEYDDDAAFILGLVREVEEDRVHMLALDPLGRWADVPSVDLVDITAVQLDTPYIRTYLRHAGPPPTART